MYISAHSKNKKTGNITTFLENPRVFFAINSVFFPFSNVQPSSTSPSSTIQFQTKCYRKPIFIKNKLDDDDGNVTCLVFFSLFLEPYLYHP